MRPVSSALVHCNGRIKTNQNGEILEIMYASRDVFKLPGWEQIGGKKPAYKGTRSDNSEPNKRSISRANRRVQELTKCNGDVLDTFVTITLSPDKCDRYSWDAAFSKLKVFLSNRVQRKGLVYVIVPELHKDGAIHFHGFMNSSALKLVDSGRKWKGKIVYNVADWKVGWTTAVKLTGDYFRACNYILKYVRKQTSGGMIGGRYYLHGGLLKEPVCTYVQFLAPPSGKRIELEDAGLTIVYVTDLAECQYEVAEVSPSRAAPAVGLADLDP